MTNKYLTCESCVYYEYRSEYNSFSCSLPHGVDTVRSYPVFAEKDNNPCSHYIEDAKHYKDRIEAKKLKTRKNIKEIERQGE
jgi:hypothetical protein